MYNFDGINDASSMMQMLEELGVHADQELPTNPTIFAARVCALKNKFHKELIGTDESNNPIYRPVLYDSDLNWYLPAQNEAPNMQDDGTYTMLSGEYWTSTAVGGTDNEHAYKYTVGSSTSSELRSISLKVRAVRKTKNNYKL